MVDKASFLFDIGTTEKRTKIPDEVVCLLNLHKPIVLSGRLWQVPFYFFFPRQSNLTQLDRLLSLKEAERFNPTEGQF